MVVINESSKLSLCDDGEECNEQVRDHLVANEVAIKISAKNVGCVDKFNKDGIYHKRERRPSREL